MLLTSDDEFEIDSSYTSRVSEIFSVILKSLGLKLDFIDDENVVDEYDDNVVKSHVIDGKEYWCTDYQFMLVQRKKDIEKELLSKYGVIDIDELEELVMNELMERSFVIGPMKDEVMTTPAYRRDTVV